MAPCCHLAVTGRKMKLTEEGERNSLWSSYQGTDGPNALRGFSHVRTRYLIAHIK